MAAYLDFPSAPVRVNGSPATIFIGGHEYLGVGALGSISMAEEGVELQAYGMTLQLSAIPRDAAIASLAEAYQGREAIVWEVLFDAAWKVIADPITIFRGRMDQMNLALGSTGKVEVKLESRLRDWERPRLRRYTSEDQRREHPADLGFEFVSKTTEKELIWPAKSFRA
ncbi:hypothetical protein [Pseudoroseomonas cervicalis]|uniref:hypothetical protein n=1 Tax=Teichococcus cervicalis TaxID=204525 RepID=UPI0027D814FF|nr:hypothetical protein [Pseudoroseomonas cervicalis]